MKLIHKKGDLFWFADNGKFDAIVHGCNAQGVMGSGIAKTVKQRWPDVFRTYQTFPLQIGYWTICRVDEGYGVVNAITQNHYLPRGVDHFEYDAFDEILESLLKSYPGYRWGFPYIGMGLAGGDSKRILAQLEAFAEKVDKQGGSVYLVEYDG